MSLRRAVAYTTFLACLIFGAISAKAASPGYDAIYVFGDSYCDVGNVYAATKGALPLSPPYFNGRFSNGPIWVEHVAGSWGLPMKPALAGGTDYAFGGAFVTSAQVTPLGTIPSVPQQVELYLSQHGGHADPKALYILEGGGNDILGAAGGSPEDLGYQIALGLAGSELLLRQAGAHHFLIPDLLDVGELPAGRPNAAFATAAVVAANKALDVLLAAEGFLQDIHVIRLNVFGLGHAVASDPTHFGFTNITTSCLNPVTGAVCSDPAHTLFWDTVHPTEFGHAFFAIAAETKLGR